MPILDAQGRPIPMDGKKPVMQEIATIERDIHRVFYGTVLPNNDDTLQQRGGAKGLKIYDELKRDAHAGAVLGKRKLAVTSRPWIVEPASDAPADVALAQLVEQALKHLRFNSVCKRLLEATLKGYAVSEVIWEIRDGRILPANVIARDARRFAFGVDGSLRLRTPGNMIEGEPMPPRKFIVHRRGADDDSPYGSGIGGMLFWPVFFKRNSITFWLTFADKFGSPTAVGKYPNGAGEAEQRTLLEALQALSQDAGVTVPEGMVIELLEAQRSGSVDTYEKLVRYMDEQMSKAVLGETMSTTAAAAGLGSTQASVQNDVRLEVAKDDGDELDETLNDTLVRWIAFYNAPTAGLPRVRRVFEEPEDLVRRATRDKTLSDMGWEPSEEYMLETYGPGWTKKAPAPAPLVPGFTPGLPPTTAGDDGGAEFADEAPALQQARGFNAQRQLAIDAGARALAAQWQPLTKSSVENLLGMLEETGDLATFRERMSDLLSAAPDEQVVEAVARATFAGNILGRGRAQPKGWREKLAALLSRRRA